MLSFCLFDSAKVRHFFDLAMALGAQNAVTGRFVD